MAFCFTTCKKYPEDGKRSWHKPNKRIVGGWYLKEFLVDGSDSTYKWYEKKTSDVTDTIRWQLIDTRFNFDDGADRKSRNGRIVDIYLPNVSRYSTIGCNSCYLHTTSAWSFDNKKTRLTFKTIDTFINPGGTETEFFIITPPISSMWNIEKLTDKEMILEANSNSNKHLRLKFQQK